MFNQSGQQVGSQINVGGNTQFPNKYSRITAIEKFISMLHEKMTDRKLNDGGALNDKEFLEWLEKEAKEFFPYTAYGASVIWQAGKFSK